MPLDLVKYLFTSQNVKNKAEASYIIADACDVSIKKAALRLQDFEKSGGLKVEEGNLIFA